MLILERWASPVGALTLPLRGCPSPQNSRGEGPGALRAGLALAAESAVRSSPAPRALTLPLRGCPSPLQGEGFQKSQQMPLLSQSP